MKGGRKKETIVGSFTLKCAGIHGCLYLIVGSKTHSNLYVSLGNCILPLIWDACVFVPISVVSGFQISDI